ncbi:MAG: type VI secretion system contractile sheath large subunit, partial [Acetobacteraceae bacterium]
MSETQAAPGATTTTQEAGVSFLDQVVAATKQTTPDQAQDLVKNLVEQALSGTVTFDKNLTRTFERAINAIDRKLSDQLNAIVHHPRFTQLEGTWRGLNYLIMNSETSTTLKIRVLNASKRDLNRDLQRAVEFDQSQLFKKIYENEFGTPGGEPYAGLIGDYEWTQHPDDIETLRLISNVAAAAFAPFISAAGAGMFGFDSWPELAKPRDLAKIFETQDYTKWRSFRDSEDARFVSLVLPRTLARLPYGAATKPVEEFGYEEAPYDDTGAARAMQHGDYCWMNAAYVMGTKLTDAFAKYGFCTAIRGAEGGGKVENLPYHVFTSDDGDLDGKCPTELAITDRREFELSNAGFLPLCHYKNTDYAVFFGAQTVQKPKKYDRPEATANAAISARLPYIMASSRFAHYLKVM